MKRIIYILIAVIFSASSIIAQDDVPDFSTRTPRSSIISFKNSFSKNNYSTENASYVLNSNLPLSKKKVLAGRLNSILKRFGKIDFEEVSDRRRYKNDDGEYKYFLYPQKHKEVYLERVRGKWLFSEETLSKVNQYYNKEIESKYKRKSSDVLTTRRGDTIKVAFSMASPYNTILSHLMFVQDSTFNNKYLARIIDDNGKLSKDECVDKTVKIYQYFLGATENWIMLEDIPKDANYTDSISGKHIFVINNNIPELYLEKIGKDWKYSYTSAKMIDELHEEIYPIGADTVFSLGKYFKSLVSVKYSKTIIFGLLLYQFLMIAFFFIVFLISFFVVKLLLKKIISSLISDHEIALITYKGFFALFLVLFNSWVLIFIPALGLGIDAVVVLNRMFGALLIFSFTYFALNAVEIWFRIMTIKEPRDVMTARKGAYTFVMAILKIITVVIGSVFIVDELGFDLAGLLAGLSIGGFAFALGAQETIKNFFGSIMIFIDKPFKVGDWVKIKDDEGMVEEVGLRSSRIRTFYNSVVIIPNSEVSNTTIDNYEERRYRRYKAYYKLPLNTDVDKIETFVKALENIIETHENTRKDFFQVKVNNIGLYSIDILFYTFFVVPDWSTELDARQELIVAVLKVAKELGVKFAVPPNVCVEGK